MLSTRPHCLLPVFTFVALLTNELTNCPHKICSDVFLFTWSFFFSDSDHNNLTVGVKSPLENPSKGSSESLAALKVHMMLACVFASKISGRWHLLIYRLMERLRLSERTFWEYQDYVRPVCNALPPYSQSKSVPIYCYLLADDLKPLL